MEYEIQVKGERKPGQERGRYRTIKTNGRPVIVKSDLQALRYLSDNAVAAPNGWRIKELSPA